MERICISDHTPFFWQWDQNRRLEIGGISDTCQVHYVQEGGESGCLVVEAQWEEGRLLAAVPNILLQTAAPITVYLYCGEETRFTAHHTVFNVEPRERPTDYVYTETEVLTWESLKAYCEEHAITPNLTFGTITMLPPGDTPTASITGTAENPVLNLAIPRAEDGADGYAITNVKILDGHLWVYIYNGAEIKGVDAGELPKGEKGDKGETGAAGADGVSCTHSWNGTTLTVTSASGASSADLKGEKGDKGDAGDTTFVITVNVSDGTYNKTVAEIQQAYASGRIPVCVYDGLVYALASCTDSGTFKFYHYNGDSMTFRSITIMDGLETVKHQTVSQVDSSLNITGRAADANAVKVALAEVEKKMPESYTLPIATADTLGGVKPVAKTEDMTQEVGVDKTGALFTMPGSGGGTEKEWRLIRTVEITEAVSSISISTDEEGNAFELDEFLIYAPLNVTASQNSQFVVSVNGKDFSSANNALGTAAKSVLVYSEWKGVRLHTVGTTTYDYASVAGNAAARRIVMGDACRTVTEIKLSGQSGATINSGTFYIYGR
ncbi:MAG: hypothetical protein J6K98_06140 [Clostridia bacterium]|nr:hypothetical protein [Clostridia bacterium]